MVGEWVEEEEVVVEGGVAAEDAGEEVIAVVIIIGPIIVMTGPIGITTIVGPHGTIQMPVIQGIVTKPVMLDIKVV